MLKLKIDLFSVSMIALGWKLSDACFAEHSLHTISWLRESLKQLFRQCLGPENRKPMFVVSDIYFDQSPSLI